MEEFKMWLELEKKIGYDAKGCLSPSQALLVNAMFQNDEQEMQRARNIVKLFELKRSEGITGFEDDAYGFIDEPIYKGALALLAKLSH